MDSLLDYLIKHYEVVVIVMSFIVFGLTYLLKLPIKHFTAKCKSESMTKWLNKLIILLPFAISFALWAILCAIGYTAITEMDAATAASLAIVIYNVVERVEKGEKVIPQDISKEVEKVDEETENVKQNAAELSKNDVFENLVKKIKDE